MLETRIVTISKRMRYLPPETREILDGEDVFITWASFKNLFDDFNCQLHAGSDPQMTAPTREYRKLQYIPTRQNIINSGFSGDMNWLYKPNAPFFAGERAVWEATDTLDRSNTIWYITEVYLVNKDHPGNTSYANYMAMVNLHKTNSQAILEKRISPLNEVNGRKLWDNKILEDNAVERAYYLGHWLDDKIADLMDPIDYGLGPIDVNLLSHFPGQNESRQNKNLNIFKMALNNLQELILRSSSVFYKDTLSFTVHGINTRWKAQSNWYGPYYHIYEDPYETIKSGLSYLAPSARLWQVL
ncbi:hypothetical protein BCON_0431g00020 [Botryotinia convoluta]|uniref:Uncharacterized protein n=1 Tax=Botryotinia convoluta TaxID=54673 RepID=A0A4Z1H7B2_9HELO|nr:hypothetical protein BCON_0431g00020 [Botryotinia convoluta]